MANTISFEQLDPRSIQQLKVGDQLIRYRRKPNFLNVFQEHPSTAFTYCRVIGMPNDEDIVLALSSDRQGAGRKYKRSTLLSGQWWVHPIHIPDPTEAIK